MSTDDAQDVPRDVLLKAIGLFRTADRRESLAKRMVAVLSFDSLSLAPAFGTRSGQTDARQLIYSAGDSDIDLHVSTNDKQWIIAGQLLGKTCVNGKVELDGEGVSFSSQLDESCEFQLPAVSSGHYRLRILLSDIELEVPRIELRK